MKTQEEFNKLTKPKMVIAIIELMVSDGWDIQSFIYTFRSFTKEDLIKQYEYYLEYNNSLQPNN